MQQTLAIRSAELLLPTKQGLDCLCVFSGIVCPLEASRQLGMPINSVKVVDWEPTTTHIAKHNFSIIDDQALPQNVEDITEQHIAACGNIDVLHGSPPCTNFSRALVDRGAGVDGRTGLAGPTGRLFYKMMEIWRWVLKYNPHCRYIIENVVFDDMPDWAEVCAILGTPVVLNAKDYSCTWRQRAYWTNIDLPQGWQVPVENEMHPDMVLPSGCTMVNKSAPTITASWRLQNGVVVERTRQPLMVWDAALGMQRHLVPEEAEVLMGLPEGYTAAPGVAGHDRLRAIGNGIDVRVLCQLLRHYRAGPVPQEEMAVRQPRDGCWARPIEEEVTGELTLNAVNMAKWLTPGPCPCPQAAQGWQEAWQHPTVEKDVVEWAHGADLRFEGDRSQEVAAPNCASCYTAAEEMRKTIWDGVAAGHMFGPYATPPLQGFKQTPRALIDEMLKSGKYRPISVNNLPKGQAVNDDIPDSPTPICLTTHTRLQQLMRIQKARRTGHGVWLAKRDLKSAYRNHAVHPRDWHLCGLQWDGQYFVDERLSFGCRSSVDRFLTVSDAIEWALRRWGVQVVHYIDDFCFVCGSEAEALEAVRKFEVICEEFGIPIKRQKDEGPAKVVEMLGVVYDMNTYTAAMPQGKLQLIKDGCEKVLVGCVTKKEAMSLVGLQTWAAACIPQARTFIPALRHAAEIATKDVHCTQRARLDAQWWLGVINKGLARDGVAILPSEVTPDIVMAGDAGSEWGMGAHSDTTFYRAATPAHVTRAAMRRTRVSSKHLELFQMLVLARVHSAQWKGKHVRVWVDNQALDPLFRKMYSSKQGDNDILREIASLQAVDGWSWDVVWHSRTQNEPADALSKNDMKRFELLMGEGLQELEVTAEHLREPVLGALPQRAVAVFSGKGRASARAAGHPARRPTRQVLGDELGCVALGGSLESSLRGQLRYIQAQIKKPLDATGVQSYLRFCERMQWGAERLLPDWDMMVENLQLYVIDAVQSYSWRVGCVMMTKKAITPASVATYLTQINKWYAAETFQDGVTLAPQLKAVMKHLVKAFPKGNSQKDGLSATHLRAVLDALRCLPLAWQEARMWEAMFTLAWFGVLRPGEFTVATGVGYDVTKDPAKANVLFYDGDEEIPAGAPGRFPTHMVFVVKQSKTDQDRLTKDVVIGCSGGDLCAVTAMWWYLAQDARASQEMLFGVQSLPVTYTQMRRMLTKCLTAAGLDSKRFGGHSFRIGGSQALAAAGKSVLYIMSYGRWKCVDSVLRYVATPEFVRTVDARDMATAVVDAPWTNIEAAINTHYDKLPTQDKLWAAPSMLRTASTERVVAA